MNIRPQDFLGVGIVFLLILFVMGKTKKFAAVTSPLKRRKGVGDFGAYRSAHPTIPHQGQDFLVSPGSAVYAPISGRVRIAMPYRDDPRFSGVEVIGMGKEASYKVKVFYIQPTVTGGQLVNRGDVIGYAQDLGIKYSASTPNHVHVEVRVGGVVVNPTGYFGPDNKVLPAAIA